jgi:hypothetical protein
MNAIEGLMAGVRARRERAAAAEREMLNRIVEPIVLRVCEGIEATGAAANSEPFDKAQAELLFSQAMARFRRRHEAEHQGLWSTVSRACMASLRLAHHNQSRA